MIARSEMAEPIVMRRNGLTACIRLALDYMDDHEMEQDYPHAYREWERILQAIQNGRPVKVEDQ